MTKTLAQGLSQAPPAPVVLGTLIARYALAGAVAFAGECALDAALRSHGPLHWLGYAAGLGSVAGALSGSALAIALILLRALRGRARIAYVLVCGLGFAAYAQNELGIVDRLSGRYSMLAWAAISCIALLCAGVTALAYAVAPRGLGSLYAERDNWLMRATCLQRRMLLLLLLLGAAAALLVDARVWVDQYAFFHQLLRKSARIAATVALAQLTLPLGARGRATTTSAICVLTTVALVALSSERAGALGTLRQAELVDLALTELRTLSDIDADGFAAWLDGGDCAAFDPSIHPGARELPGNGIDDNCRLGDLTPELPRPREAAVLRAQPGAPSIVLITIDTLRADHIGLYGYPRATTPNIDGFFASGTRFADAVAPGAYTTISMPALMRGMYARHLSWGVAIQTNRFRLLPPAHRTDLAPGEEPMNAQLIVHDAEQPALAERLRALGYHTLAVVDDGGSSFLSRAIMGQGFEQYVSVSDESSVLWDPRGDEHVASRALELLQAAPTAQPFLLWLHFYGAHAPDAHHPDVRSFGDGRIDRYDHEIASVDQHVGRVLAAISGMQQSRPMLTVLTADHGESFHALGRAHGVSLSEDELHVPLLLRGPGFTSAAMRGSVSLVDIVPTVLTMVTGQAPVGLDGVPLQSPLTAAARTVFSDLWRYDARGRIESEHVAAVAGAERLEWDVLANTLSAYRRPGRNAYYPPPPALETAVFGYLERAAAQPENLLE